MTDNQQASRAEDSFDSLKVRTRYYLLAILTIALFMRTYHLVEGSLWTDEFATYWTATAETVRDCVSRAVITQGQSPFYYLMIRLFLLFLPDNEFSLRLLSLGCSLLSVVFIYDLSRLIFPDNKTAIVSSLIFAVHQVQIYYAQEARPYAPAIMLSLLSQIYFLRYLRDQTRKNMTFYALFSISLCYCHFIFGPLLIVQNLYYFYLRYRGKQDSLPSLQKWFSIQTVIGVALLGLLFQLQGMFASRGNWNWLQDMDLVAAGKMFLGMFDPKVMVILAIFFLVFLTTEKVDFRSALKRNRYPIVLLGSWVLIPFLFIFVVSKLFGVSLFDPRYLLLSLIPFYLLLAHFLCVFKSDILRTTFPGAFLVLYLGFVLIPSYVAQGRFALRVNHNWRGALTFIQENFEPGDAVILRTGFVKENWVPGTERQVVRDYVKCPFASFYWQRPQPDIYNLTYTWEKDFDSYYEAIFQQAAQHQRIWLLGVNPPNTNYPVSRLAPFLEKEYLMIRIYEADFSGVYLCLLVVIKDHVKLLEEEAVIPEEDVLAEEVKAILSPAQL